MEELRKSLPKDVELNLIYASSDNVKNSLEGLKHTLVGRQASISARVAFKYWVTTSTPNAPNTRWRGGLGLSVIPIMACAARTGSPG